MRWGIMRWQPPDSSDKTLQNIINKIKTESYEPQIVILTMCPLNYGFIYYTSTAEYIKYLLKSNC